MQQCVVCLEDMEPGQEVRPAEGGEGGIFLFMLVFSLLSVPGGCPPLVYPSVR